MKRSTQLITESVVIGLLLLGILFGGTLSSSAPPQSWLTVQNPNAVQAQYNLTAISVFYNDTLSSLDTYQYQAVSGSLGEFQFLAVPQSLDSAAQNANQEIASMNQSLSAIQYYLNETASFYNIGEFANASIALDSFCSDIQSANTSLNQFAGPTTSSFSRDGVPVNIYDQPVAVLQNETASYYKFCLSYRAELNSEPSLLTISSAQTPLSPYGRLWVYTGGELNLTVSLENEDKVGVGSQIVTFHVGGLNTSLANLTTGSGGAAYGSFTIPYLYQSTVDVWATADANSTTGLPSVVSNTLVLNLLYVPTQIVIQDPPSVLPTFPFTVSGRLFTASGVPLPNAPVMITSLDNVSYFVTTDSSGAFTDTLTVPANATDGVHYIYAAFAANGEYGPSINFTSIAVYRLPLTLTVNAPSIIFSGIPATLEGTVSANGSRLANTNIQLNTPWGIYNTTSDSSGRYRISLSVPLSELAFSKQVTVSASPAEPYFARSSSSVALSSLNLIMVVILACAAGFGIYQARNLDIHLPPQRQRKEKPREGEQELLASVAKILAQKEAGSTKSQVAGIPSIIEHSFATSPLVTSYMDALLLASKRFGIRFTQSMTIRETINHVSHFDKEGKGTPLFSIIALAVEDYLYSEEKLRAKVSDARKAAVEDSLRKLRDLWSNTPSPSPLPS